MNQKTDDVKPRKTIIEIPIETEKEEEKTENLSSILIFDSYQGLIDEMSDFNIRYKSNSSSVIEMMNYCSVIEKKKKELYEPTHYLWEFLSDNINDPSPKTSDIEEFINKTGMAKEKVKNFFKNQRKRHLIPLSQKLDRDFEILVDKINEDDPTIDGYMQKISGMHDN